MLIDSHCHIALLPDEQLKQAMNSNFVFMATGGTHAENERLISLKSKNFFNVLGVSPLEKCDLKKEKDLISNNKPYAVGEIGLDFYWVRDKKQQEEQIEKFLEMLALAESLNLPVVVHSRNAEQRVLELLAEFHLPVLMHCFSGFDVSEVLKRDYLISIPPRINAQRKEIIKNTPISNLLVESDAPAIGGTFDALKSAELISKIKELPLDDVVLNVNRNAKVFFGLGGLFV